MPKQERPKKVTVKDLVFNRLRLKEESLDFANNLEGGKRELFIAEIQLEANTSSIPVLSTTVDRYIRAYAKDRSNTFKATNNSTSN